MTSLSDLDPMVAALIVLKQFVRDRLRFSQKAVTWVQHEEKDTKGHSEDKAIFFEGKVDAFREVISMINEIETTYLGKNQ